MNVEPIQTPEPELNFRETARTGFRILKNGRWCILLATLVAVIAAVGALKILPNVYTSEATIQIVEQQIPQNVVAPLSTMTVAEKLAGLKREVLSRGRLMQIVAETGVYADRKTLSPEGAVELLRKSVDITPVDVTREGSFTAFSISFSAGSPALAQLVTTKLSSFFIEKHSETQANQVMATTNFLGDQLVAKRKQADELAQQIRDLKLKFMGELPEERIVNESRLSELRNELQNTLNNINHAREQRILLQSTLTGSLSTKLGRLKEERALLLTRYTPKYQKVVEKDEEIAQMQTLIARIQSGAAVGEELKRADINDPGTPQVEAQLNANRMEIENLTAEQKKIEAQIGGYQHHIDMTPAHEAQLSAMERELDTVNQQITGLLKMDQQSGLSADMERRQEGQQFRQLDAASFPVKPSSPARLKIALGALVAGLALGLAIAFLLEMRRPAFHTEQELRTKFGPPLVLSVPVLPTPAETRKRRVTAGFEWVGATTVAVVLAAIEFYVYKHS